MPTSRILYPLELIFGVKRKVNEARLSSEDSEHTFEFTEEEIVEALNDTISNLFEKYQASHGHLYEVEMELTMVAGQEAYPLTSQTVDMAVVDIVDQDETELDVISLHDKKRYVSSGYNCCWITYDPASGTVINVLVPGDITTLTVRWIYAPRRMIGGRGTSNNGSGKARAAVPYYGIILDSYYSLTESYVESADVVDGKPTSLSRALVLANASGNLDWDSTNIGDDVVWATHPEWAPVCAKRFITLKAAYQLIESRDDMPPARWDQGLVSAEYDFKATYSPSPTRVLRPAILRDKMGA